jgi:hypothetical protein
MAVLAPMPEASVSTATNVNSGFAHNIRAVAKVLEHLLLQTPGLKPQGVPERAERAPKQPETASGAEPAPTPQYARAVLQLRLPLPPPARYVKKNVAGIAPRYDFGAP